MQQAFGGCFKARLEDKEIWVVLEGCTECARFDCS